MLSSSIQPNNSIAESLTPRILVVDDNPDIHNDFKKVLCTRSEVDIDNEFEAMDALFNDEKKSRVAPLPKLTIDSALQGKTAARMVSESLAEGKPYSIAFIDVRMPPGWDGIETTRRLWELDPEIQVVICSAYSDCSWQQIIEELNHSDRFLVLKKPFDNIEIRQIATVLHNRWAENRSDVLTGVLNRRALMGHVTQQQSVAVSEQQPLSCAMIDLDYFKRINDLHGHLAGDLVLKNAAELLQQHCCNGDLVCRYGGEEFCVLLKNMSEKEAVEWASLAKEDLAKLAIDIGSTTIGVTGSFGISTLLDDMDDNHDADSLLDKADQALLAAKATGRDRVVAYSTLGNADAGQARLPQDLFGSAYAAQIMQPVVSIQSGASFDAAARTLAQESGGSLPVVGDTGNVVGLLTEQDLLCSMAKTDLHKITVDNVMQKDIACFSERTPLQVIHEFLTKVAIPQVVVTNDGVPTGVVDRKALLNCLLSDQG